jgi:hypothetical protein
MQHEYDAVHSAGTLPRQDCSSSRVTLVGTDGNSLSTIDERTPFELDVSPRDEAFTLSNAGDSLARALVRRRSDTLAQPAVLLTPDVLHSVVLCTQTCAFYSRRA